MATPIPISWRVPYDPRRAPKRGPERGRDSVAKLLPALKAHKPDILAALAHPLPPLSAAAYELVGYFEERLAAVQRYAPTELHMNSRPPTVAAVRDAVRATLALAQARGFAQREVIEALEGYPEAARFLLVELGRSSAPKSPEPAARLSPEKGSPRIKELAARPEGGQPEPRAPVLLDEALRTACEGVAGITPAQFRSLLSPEDIDDIAAGGIHPKALHGYVQSFAAGMRSRRIVVPGGEP
jgi:hypothetical protein